MLLPPPWTNFSFTFTLTLSFSNHYENNYSADRVTESLPTYEDLLLCLLYFIIYCTGKTLMFHSYFTRSKRLLVWDIGWVTVNFWKQFNLEEERNLLRIYTGFVFCGGYFTCVLTDVTEERYSVWRYHCKVKGFLKCRNFVGTCGIISHILE